jgi:RES domain-containing protein
MPSGWRITKTSRVDVAFDGEGARLHGGRWNSPGAAVVYTAQSESLAALELLVHLQSSQLLASYSSVSASFSRDLVEAVDSARLPADWRRYPAPFALQEMGDQWITGRRSVVLEVPSAVVPSESLFLLNPAHPDFPQIIIGAPGPFLFDPRLK